MPGTVNQVILMGRLGGDPVMRQSQGGNTPANARLATDRYRNGQEPLTDWHTIVAWGKAAEILMERAHKGDMVHIVGRIVNNSWTGDDGQRRERTEIHTNNIVPLGRPGPSSPPVQNSSNGAAAPNSATVPPQGQNPEDIPTPDIAF